MAPCASFSVEGSIRRANGFPSLATLHLMFLSLMSQQLFDVPSHFLSFKQFKQQSKSLCQKMTNIYTHEVLCGQTVAISKRLPLDVFIQATRCRCSLLLFGSLPDLRHGDSSWVVLRLVSWRMIFVYTETETLETPVKTRRVCIYIYIYIHIFV